MSSSGEPNQGASNPSEITASHDALAPPLARGYDVDVHLSEPGRVSESDVNACAQITDS